MNAEPISKRIIPNVAVVGAGYWGKNLVRNFHELGALCMVCESDLERTHGLRQRAAVLACDCSPC